MENGEVDGRCGILEASVLGWLDRGFAKICFTSSGLPTSSSSTDFRPAS